MTSRTSRYFLGLVAMLAAHAASAVGLGEFKLLSAMDEPLRAEISLLNIGDLNESQIVAKLASPEDFKRSGVEREFQLTDLRFKVDLSNRTNPVIRVSSQRPIKEPYLNFLVELNWTSGRLLREYTTLLDLPVYAGAQHAGKTAAAASPAAAPKSRPEESSLQPEAPRRAPGHRAPRAAARSTAAAGGSYRVQSGDTLWNIATHNQAPGISIQQTMQAIVAANPEAFIQGNPNLIRRDALLNLPDAAAMAAADSRAFTPGTPSAQKTPSERPIESRTHAADSPVSGNAGGELRLAGGTATDSGAGAAGRQSGGGAGAARADLGAVLEEKDRLERENAELKARVANLEEQAKAASRLVEISDPGLAALQTGAPKAPVDTAAPPAETPAAEQPTAPAKVPAEAGAPGAETTPAAAPTPVAPTPVAAPPAPPPAAPNLEEKVQDAITALRAWLVPVLGVAGALLLLVMGVAAWRGRTQQQGLELPREFEGKGAGATQFSAEPVALADEDLLPDTHGFRQGPDEILEEVDVCLSFGNEQQARELLTEALAKHPEHAGLHLKMLELLVQEGDRPGCEALLPKLRALGDPRALETAVALMGELPGFDGDEPAAVAPSETAEILLHPAAAHAVPPLDEPAHAEDFDLDLDLGLDLPESSAVVEQAAKPQAELPGALDDLDLDLDLDLFGSDVPAEPSETAALVAVPAATADMAAEAHQASPLDGDLELFEPGQEMATQIELAEAYVDMGDAEGAREILDYVLEGGDDEQKESARRLLARLG